MRRALIVPEWSLNYPVGMTDTKNSVLATTARGARTLGLLGGASAIVGVPTMAMLLSSAGSVGASVTLTVDTLDDGAATASDCTTPVANSCSLRDALDAAQDGDTIDFASGLTGTISLNSEIVVGVGVTITGPGADELTVAQTAHFRIFDFGFGASDVTISGLTLANGDTSDRGGAIRAFNSGSFTLDSVVLSGNTSDGGGGAVVTHINGTGAISIRNSTIDGSTSLNGWAGGLYLSGQGRSIEIIDSTISNNSTNGAAGGIGVFGSGNSVTIANSTITGNSADGGGGVLIYDTNTVSFLMSTISGNVATHVATAAGYGAGVAIQSNYNDPGYPIGSLSFDGTIISDNSSVASPGEADIAISGPSMSITIANSLVGSSTSYIDGGGNVVSTSPGLGPLADNGGPTKTMALLSGSPAIGAGPTTVPTFASNQFDQRGVGFDRVSGGRSDVGAFEVQGVPEPTTTTTAPVVTTTTAGTDPVVPAFTG